MSTVSKFKRFIAAFLVVLTLANICMTSASASDLPQIQTSYQHYSFDKDKVSAFIKQQLDLRNPKIDISEFNISKKECNIYNLIYEIPTSFNASIMSYSVDGKYTSLHVEYIYPKSEYSDCLKLLDRNTEFLLRGLRDSEIPDIAKALIVHDRLVCWCCYDNINYDNNSIPEIDYQTYGIIVNRTGVCAGYARAYKFLLNSLGIKCEYINSKELNHAWNIVTLNGRNYHVDCTWDETYCELTGNVEHANFLRSTAGIKETKHNASDFDSTPRDTTFDSCYWQESNSSIQLYDNALWYIDYRTGDLKKRTGNTEQVVISIPGKWKGGSSGICYSKLESDGRFLYYTTPDAVYSVDPSGRTECVFTPDMPSGCSIYGFEICNGDATVYCTAKPKYHSGYDSYSKYSFFTGYRDAPEGTEPTQHANSTQTENIYHVSSDTYSGNILSVIFGFMSAVLNLFLSIFSIL